MAADWYYRSGDQVVGPLPWSRVMELAELGQLLADTPLRKGLDGRWLRAAALPALCLDGTEQATAAQAVSGTNSPVAAAEMVSRALAAQIEQARARAEQEASKLAELAIRRQASGYQCVRCGTHYHGTEGPCPKCESSLVFDDPHRVCQKCQFVLRWQDAGDRCPRCGNHDVIGKEPDYDTHVCADCDWILEADDGACPLCGSQRRTGRHGSATAGRILQRMIRPFVIRRDSHKQVLGPGSRGYYHERYDRADGRCHFCRRRHADPNFHFVGRLRFYFVTGEFSQSSTTFGGGRMITQTTRSKDTMLPTVSSPRCESCARIHSHAPLLVPALGFVLIVLLGIVAGFYFQWLRFGMGRAQDTFLILVILASPLLSVAYLLTGWPDAGSEYPSQIGGGGQSPWSFFILEFPARLVSRLVHRIAYGTRMPIFYQEIQARVPAKDDPSWVPWPIGRDARNTLLWIALSIVLLPVLLGLISLAIVVFRGP